MSLEQNYESHELSENEIPFINLFCCYATIVSHTFSATGLLLLVAFLSGGAHIFQRGWGQFLRKRNYIF